MPGSSGKRQYQGLVGPFEKRPRLEPDQRDVVEDVNEHVFSDTDKAEEICLDCRKIAMESIFSVDLRSSQLFKTWSGVRFALPNLHPQSKCPLCRFFYHERTISSDKSEIDPLYELRVLSARDYFGASQIRFDDSPVFVVVPATYNKRETGGVIMELSYVSDAFHGRQIKSQIDMSLLKGWLEFCDENHRTVCRKLDPSLPQGFRVIDCLTRRIILAETLASQKNYVALSYVWGDQTEHVPASVDMPLGKLPATIEDAILLTTGLGYQYLWIDRYCIPQDNPVERQQQIQNMDAIYEQSVVTIIAAAGEDPHYGLPGVGSKLRLHQPQTKIGSRTFISAPFARPEILRSKWNSRGWTYQEGLLCRRRLVFTDTQVYFQCKSMHCLESIYAPLEILHTNKNNRMRDQVDMSRVFPLRGLGKYPKHLQDRLNEYLERSLTFEKDILDAFRGVLTAFERDFSSPVKSFCGIPLFCDDSSTATLEVLIFGLSWSPRYKGSRKAKRRPGFPSWTWTGWELDQVIYNTTGSWQEIRNLDRLKSLIDVSVEYLDGLVLTWDGNQDQILAQERTGTYPVLLHISGPTLSVQIHPDGLIYTAEDEVVTSRRSITRMRNNPLIQQAVRYVRSAYDLNEEEDSPIPFTFLIMGHLERSRFLLLLYCPENCVWFERIDCWQLGNMFWEGSVVADIVTLESLNSRNREKILIK